MLSVKLPVLSGALEPQPGLVLIDEPPPEPPAADPPAAVPPLAPAAPPPCPPAPDTLLPAPPGPAEPPLLESPPAVPAEELEEAPAAAGAPPVAGLPAVSAAPPADGLPPVGSAPPVPARPPVPEFVSEGDEQLQSAQPRPTSAHEPANQARCSDSMIFPMTLRVGRSEWTTSASVARGKLRRPRGVGERANWSSPEPIRGARCC